ncbi:hypothetical protein [Cohnella sp.]|uniref:hypothetical protein n=1 Tax=Cohnella sp. TaxID=1883426 RepID=UPI003703AB19
MESTMDQSLNIGMEVTLSEGVVKQVKIGSVKLIREVRNRMKDVRYRFSFCVGREKSEIGDDEIDFPAAEAAYRETFAAVLVGGLTDEEYEDADVEVLDKLLDRFL